MNKRWTKEEVDWLKANAATHSVKEVAKKLERSERSISQKAKRLGLYFNVARYWTKEQVQWLKDNASQHTCGQAAKYLNKSPLATSTKAAKLGIKLKPTKTLWTKVEEEWLKATAANISAGDAAIYLKRSKQSVLHKAKNLGVSFKDDTFSPGRWTQEEVDWLVENARDITSADAAYHLKRSLSAVKYKAGSLRIKFGKRINNRGTVRLWTKEEDGRLWGLAETYSLEDIGKMLGRTPAAVFNRCRHLGISLMQARGTNVALAEYMGIKVNLLHKYKTKLGLRFLTSDSPKYPTNQQIATVAKHILLNGKSDAAVNINKLKAAVRDNVKRRYTGQKIASIFDQRGVEGLLKDVLVEDKVLSRKLADSIAKMRASVTEFEETLAYVIREEKKEEADAPRALCA